MKAFIVHEDACMSVFAGEPNASINLYCSKSGLNQENIIFVSNPDEMRVYLRVDYLNLSDSFQKYCWDNNVEFFLFPTSYKEDGRNSNMANLDYNWELDLPTPVKKSVLKGIILNSKNCLEFREAVKNLINPSLKAREFKQIDCNLNLLVADIWLSENLFNRGLPPKTISLAVNLAHNEDLVQNKFDRFSNYHIERDSNGLCYIVENIAKEEKQENLDDLEGQDRFI